MASGGRRSINIITSGPGNYDQEYVNKKLAKAQMKVAAAMQKVQRSQNQFSFGSSTDSSSSDDDDDDVGHGHHSKGIKKKTDGASIEIKKTMGNGAIANINIESANNVQLGDHNVMVINNAKRPKETNVPSPAIEDVTPPPQLTAAQQAVLDSVEVVDERKLNILAGFIGKQWRRIFRKLGLTEEEIDRLHIDHQAAEGIKTVIYKGLVNWRQKNGRNATVGKLVQVVYSITNNVQVIDRMI